MKRREFLHVAGFFVVSASATGLGAGCGDDDGGGPDPDGSVVGTFSFPQGVASGDPRPSSVVLWTRVVDDAGGAGEITVTVEVATDDAFTALVASHDVTASAESDYTIRILVTDLAAATTYHYRFRAGSGEIAGRTRTAPAKDADVAVNFAWVSCQDFTAGNYGAYRQLITDDEARAPADQIQFIVHLGDFVYETAGSFFQGGLDANFEPVALVNADGSPRSVGDLPSGGGDAGGDGRYAETVDDYRHLYKAYLADPDLREARARWPFVQTWDDHEFTNDCWQSQANYDNADSVDEPQQARKLAANQAWFEYIPCQLSGATGVDGVPSEAHDFTPATVEDAAFTAPNADNFVDEPNNVAAVGSLTIYRSLRFGRHMELVITDERSYRSDHAIPEEISLGSPVFFDPRNAVPLEMVNGMDAGATANGGNPPATFFNLFENTRAASPPGTMLGAAQKAWWKATMQGSDATWKIWGNEVSLLRLLIKATGDYGIGSLLADRVVNGDAWDGYPTERRELLSFLRDEGIANVVSISGDIHAHFAGVLLDDYDGGKPTPVGVELVAAGVSSNSLFSFFEDATRGQIPDLRGGITFDGGEALGNFVENMNLLLLHGGSAAVRMYVNNPDSGEPHDLAAALALADPDINTHLRYVDTNAQGYGLASVSATEVRASLVTIVRPINRPDGSAPGILREAQFVIPVGNPAGTEGPTVTGTKPFPLT